MDGVVVKAGAVVKRCILAENVVVGAGAKIGGDGPIVFDYRNEKNPCSLCAKTVSYTHLF